MVARNTLESMVSPEMYGNLAACSWQIWYWRRHLDVFITRYLKINLKDLQQVIARAIGNGEYIMLALLRGSGKTWLLAVCCVALAILWPESPIICVSNTAEQANLLLRKIEDELLPNTGEIARELDYSVGKGGIKIRNNGKSRVYFKDASRIQVLVLGHEGKNVIGNRGKIMVIDEAKLVGDVVCNAALKPILSYKRPVFHKLHDSVGFKDYESKIINISSAYFKSCDFYGRFKIAVKRMGLGDPASFACSLDYHVTIRWGMESEEYYKRCREEMSSVDFATEYGSIFVGASDNAVFPYSLIEPCRVLESIEIAQPKGATAQYIISVDIAGEGTNEHADNTSILVMKMIERSTTRWQKHFVWMGTYRGLTLRQIAEEVRQVYLRFPNTCRIVYDANAIGRGIGSLLDEPYVYEDYNGNSKEMPPIIPFDSTASYKSIKNLHPFIATNDLNATMASIILKNLEDRDLLLPIVSIQSRSGGIIPRLAEDDDDEDDSKDKRRRTMLLTEEAYVYKEADELQAELGNIIRRMTPQGKPLYGPALSTQKKDRYSALGMAMYHIDMLETISKKERFSKSGNSIPVAVGNF